MGLKVPKKLSSLLQPKKIKIVYGGRGSGKSMTVAGILLVRVASEAIRVGCMREMMNSIDDSVHALLCDEIERLGLDGFTVLHNGIDHVNGGRIRYKGLSRNPEAVKSMHGFNVFWCEEAGTLSKKSIDLLIPTLRAEGSELWFTFNPGSSADPICQEFLAPFEKRMTNGSFDDAMYTIIKCNYSDNPFFPENLEQLRAAHKETKPRAEYDHIWEGYYNDEVDGSIVKAEWFDAAIDAHKLPHLESLFKPRGAVVAAHDPSDTGNDDAGFAIRHGSIIEHVSSMANGEIDEKCDWATGLALKQRCDWFLWDGDGMGTGLKRQVADNLEGTRTKWHMFKGSLSGSGQDNADDIYMHESGVAGEMQFTYAESFKNNRSQYYINLADRFYNTYRVVVKGEYADPDDMISLNSEGIENLAALRSEICRIPRKPNPGGLEQIMSKQDMAKLQISSPNMSDSVMMTMWKPKARTANRTTATRFAQASVTDYDPYNL